MGFVIGKIDEKPDVGCLADCVHVIKDDEAA